MIDHCSISVKDYNQSLSFYDQTFETLGFTRVLTIDTPGQDKLAGWGKNNLLHFEISPRGKDDEEIGRARGVHFAFAAPSIQAIHAWYQKCLELGGTDNGAPGPRPEYHPGYYGAFIIDPNGWRIEAAIHDYKKGLV